MLGVLTALPVGGGDDLGVAPAAEENDPLVKDAEALHRHGDGAREVGLQCHGVEKAQVHSVEAPVEADGFHVDVDVQEPSAAALDGEGTAQNVRVLQTGVEAEMLETILILAGVEDLSGVDTDGFPNAAAALRGAGLHSIRHTMTS